MIFRKLNEDWIVDRLEESGMNLMVIILQKG